MLAFPAGVPRAYDLQPRRARLSLPEIPLAARPPAAHALRRAGRFRRARARDRRGCRAWCTTPNRWPSCAAGTLSYQDILRLEIPYSRQMVEAFWLAAGGTILAARLALEMRHRVQYRRRIPSCFPGTRRRLLRHQRYRDRGAPPAADGLIRRAMVVDAMCITATAPPRSSPATLRSSRSRFTSSITTPARSRPPAWTFTWRTASATPSICIAWATAIAPRWRCSSRNW